MKTNKSDQIGRAFEYCIVKEIKKLAKSCKSLGSTESNQDRDKKKFENLTDEDQSSLLLGAYQIGEWVNKEFFIDKNDISIERLPDSDAKKGDVTDIRVRIKDQIINLSIKHNHNALKHQRPLSAVQWCGVAKKTNADKIHREGVKEIVKDFLKSASKLNKKATTFKELKDKKRDFIDKKLYKPVCEHVSKTIIKICKDPLQVKKLFTFLTGSTDYYKIVLNSAGVSIYMFSELIPPDQVKVSITRNSYINLLFSNGWEIAMRLHTASSKLGSSLKFDSQPINIIENVPVTKF